MTTTDRLPLHTAVHVTVRGTVHKASVSAHIDTPKGLFYETRDAAGVIRKARPAHVKRAEGA